MSIQMSMSRIWIGANKKGEFEYCCTCVCSLLCQRKLGRQEVDSPRISLLAKFASSSSRKRQKNCSHFYSARGVRNLSARKQQMLRGTNASSFLSELLAGEMLSSTGKKSEAYVSLVRKLKYLQELLWKKVSSLKVYLLRGRKGKCVTYCSLES